MAGLTGRIEEFLLKLLEEGKEGMIEIGRNDLAQRFDCAPSQINYVLTTRFTPYNGYYIESRRGGSGYIRIIRLQKEQEDLVQEVLDEVVGEEITMDKARHVLEAFVKRDMLSARERSLLLLALADRALAQVPVADRNRVRAGILKNTFVLFLR